MNALKLSEPTKEKKDEILEGLREAEKHENWLADISPKDSPTQYRHRSEARRHARTSVRLIEEWGH